jgi:hypothetical protein
MLTYHWNPPREKPLQSYRGSLAAASKFLGYFTVFAAHSDDLPILELDEADMVKVGRVRAHA